MRVPVSRSKPHVEQSDIPAGTTPPHVGQRRACAAPRRRWGVAAQFFCSSNNASASPTCAVAGCAGPAVSVIIGRSKVSRRSSATVGMAGSLSGLIPLLLGATQRGPGRGRSSSRGWHDLSRLSRNSPDRLRWRRTCSHTWGTSAACSPRFRASRARYRIAGTGWYGAWDGTSGGPDEYDQVFEAQRCHSSPSIGGIIMIFTAFDRATS